MGIELLEKGRVRLWTQVEKCTSACKVDYVFNDAILTQGQVGIFPKHNLKLLLWLFCPLCQFLTIHRSEFPHFQKYSMNFDRSTGNIEMIMDSLEVTDEGTFTFNLVDGKAKGTTSLVLIGDGKSYIQICLCINGRGG